MRAMGVVVALISFMACVGEDPDAVPTSSSSGGGAGTRNVKCSGTACDVGDVCCLTFGGSSIASSECTTRDACSKPFLECDDTADCEAGQICCIETGGNSVQWGPSYCAKECRPGEPDRQLCAESSECASKSCTGTERSVTPTGLKTCAK